MAKKKQVSDYRTVKCACCGRYEKVVDKNVIDWYCSDCSFGNGNYFRKKLGWKIIKPVEKVRKGTVVSSVFGKDYKILDFGYKYDNTTYYYAVPVNAKDGIPEFIGDHQIILK